MAADEPGGLPQLGERLDFLFATVPQPDGVSPHTVDSAAAALTAAGSPVTAGYLRSLRMNRKRNPTASLLGAIAKLFGVPIAYFFEDAAADRIQSQLTALNRLRAGGVTGIMGRGSGLTADDIAALGPLFDEIREMQRGHQDEDTQR